MKNIILYTLIATLSFPLFAKAEDMKLPVINKPAALEEGTQTALSAAQVEELMPWAKDSKIFLVDLIDNIQGLSTSDKIERLVDGIKQVVGESSPKNSELLMRYALNRGLVLNETLSKETAEDAVGSADAKLRVLRASIDLAIKYYDTDMAILQKKTTAPFVIFGLDYFSFLTELNKSVFDASAQYAIQRTALEWLQWDLYRDLNNTAYAPQIVKINNSLKTFPNKKLTDAQAIASIRQMKSIAQQLKISETLKKLETDKALAMARSQADRQAILRKQQEEADRLEMEKNLEARNNGRPMDRLTLNKNDQVIHKNTLRKIEYLTDRDQVVLAYEAYSYDQTVANRNDVEKTLTNYLGLKAGDQVFFGNTIRTVQVIGEKGTVVLAYVAYSYDTTYASIDKVSRIVNSYGRFNKGDKVLFQNNIRTIESLDEKGRVSLAYVAYSYDQVFTTVDQLSKAY
jgi:hypothetical protein